MNEPMTPSDRVEREAAPELSAEERQVLARIEKRARPRRRKPWWRRVNDTTLFYWFYWW